MTPFTTLTGFAAALPIANIDTDRILAAEFLKTTSRSGLGKHLFHTLRADPAFVLNVAPWNEASIIVALENFGCGSSREHAPWALLDFGIRCVIAPSFADIFYGNCLRNGILPIKLAQAEIDLLLQAAAEPARARFTVELAGQLLTVDGLAPIKFEISPSAKTALLKGEDEIAQSEQHAASIKAFEADRQRAEPWRASIPRLHFDAA